jgi:hypothetical protein
VAVGVVGGLARFARPEAWVLVPLLLGAAALRARRDASARGAFVALAVALGVVNVVGVAWTGVLAPQLSLFTVGRFEELMGGAGGRASPEVWTILRAVLGNVAGELDLLLLPRTAWVVLPLAALALAPGARAAPGERRLVVWAGAFVLATAGVWSTSDPSRFTITPFALLAPVACVELEAWRRRLPPGRPRQVAASVAAASLVLVLGHHAGRVARALAVEWPGEITLSPGEPALADPWSYALYAGAPARLAQTR